MNAAFFDMDGTLIDSRHDLAATVNHTRRDLGLKELPVEEVLQHVGLGAAHLLQNSIPEATENVDELKRIFMSHYSEHMLETVTLYPGVRSTLEELRRRGWRLGINTAKPAFAVKEILAKFGLQQFFGAAVIAGGDCAEMKPSALPLRECAARMGGHRLSAYDWMVGDNWTDMQCAENAGVKSAFCLFGFGKLNGSRTTISLSSFSDLLRYLKPEDDY